MKNRLSVALLAAAIASPIAACNPLGPKSCGAPKEWVTVRGIKNDTAWSLTRWANPNLKCDIRTAVKQATDRNGGGPRIGHEFQVPKW
jgi:hypothetical protein